LTAVGHAPGATALVQAGVARDVTEAHARLAQALASGEAAGRFARMVAGLGGPTDLLDRPARHLAAAPVRRPVPASADGIVAAIDTRALGLAVVEVGGGRRGSDDRIDPAVGLSALLGLGERVARGAPLAVVHAATEAAADAAARTVQAAYAIADEAPRIDPLIAGRITEDAT